MGKPHMAITWGFVGIAFWCVVAFLLCGCATPPDNLSNAFAAVNHRASYSHYTGWDNRVLHAGDKGNCAAFAHTYQDEAMKRGVPTFVKACTVRDGQQHAFTVTFDGVWAMDVRQRWVVPVGEVGCQ